MFISRLMYNDLKEQISELKAECEALKLYNKQLVDRLLAKAEVPLTPEQIYDNMVKTMKHSNEELSIFEDLDGGDTGDSMEAAFNKPVEKNEVEELL